MFCHFIFFSTKGSVKQVEASETLARDIRFGPILCQIGAEWDKFGTYPDHISVHIGSVSQNVQKCDLDKSRPSQNVLKSDQDKFRPVPPENFGRDCWQFLGKWHFFCIWQFLHFFAIFNSLFCFYCNSYCFFPDIIEINFFFKFTKK